MDVCITREEEDPGCVAQQTNTSDWDDDLGEGGEFRNMDRKMRTTVVELEREASSK